MSTPTPTPNPIHPKVAAAIITTGALTVIVAIITSITPTLFSFLGDWAPVAFAGVVALGGFLAGYIKKS